MRIEEEKVNEEVWKDVAGFNGKYQVSSHGNVRSLHSGRPKLLKPARNSGGYMRVCLNLDKKIKNFFVHTLVLEAFVGPRGEGQVCCHWDSCPGNNALTNLRWGSQEENEADKKRAGTAVEGERVWSARLSSKDIEKIRDELRAGKRVGILAKQYGVHNSAISKIKLNQRWKSAA